MDLVSVIIPCYNQGKYIDESVQSVLDSSYENIEIVIVNDGSTDDYTNNRLSRGTWRKTVIYTTANQGVANARNFAIEKSSGDYILPLDADDKIANDYIRQAVEKFERNPEVKVVTCEVQLFGAKHGKLLLPDHSMEMLLARNTIVVTSMFRRSDFINTNGFNNKLTHGFEDWDFWLTILESGGEVYKLRYLGFFYRINRNSRNSSLKSEQFSILRRQIYENHYNLYSTHFFDPTKSFEFDLIKYSMEYKVGTAILKPIRFVNKLFR